MCMGSFAEPDSLFLQCTGYQGLTARAEGEEHEVEAEMGGKWVVLGGGKSWHSWLWLYST